jgi:hypothetical protein
MGITRDTSGSWGFHGEPDNALARFARAYVTGEGEALWQRLPEAVAELRQRGDERLAGFIQAMSAGSLLSAGRFGEVDTAISVLAEGYRESGPPTLLSWTLQTLGYSASFQGDPETAGRLFGESSEVDIPAGTLSANKIIEAREAFRRGQRSQAFEILRSYVDSLLETSNFVAASVVSIDFIGMMAATGRVSEAATMLGYLESVNDFGALAARTMVSQAARDAAATGERARTGLGDREALEYMRGALG